MKEAGRIFSIAFLKKLQKINLPYKLMTNCQVYWVLILHEVYHKNVNLARHMFLFNLSFYLLFVMQMNLILVGLAGSLFLYYTRRNLHPPDR